MQPGQRHQTLSDNHLPRKPRGGLDPTLDSARIHRSDRRPLNLAYVEQHSEDLTYYLFEAPAPRDAVQVLKEVRLPLGEGHLVLAIIGSSHFLEFTLGKGVVCEMLACPRSGMGDLPRLEEAKASDAGAIRIDRPGIQYGFELSQELLSREAFEDKSALLSRVRPASLVYAFPEKDTHEKALTSIDWKLAGGRATITTHHTFPGELSIVATRSYLCVAEDGALS